MTAKEYLMQYREAVRKADAAICHLDELRALAERITPNYSITGGSSHTAGDKLGEAVAKIIDAESRVNDDIEMLIATQREVERTIEAVQDDRMRMLLREVYISGKRLVQIAYELGQSYEHICRLHGCALQAVRDVMPHT